MIVRVERPSSTNQVLSIDTPSAAWTIDAIDALVGAVAASAGLGVDWAQDVRIAVHEAFMNALLHGNEQNESRRISLRVSLGVEGIEVDVQDQGQGFEPSAVPDPRAAQNLSRSCGRGLLFMRALMDEVTFLRHTAGGTYVRMRKRRSPAHAARVKGQGVSSATVPGTLPPSPTPPGGRRES